MSKNIKKMAAISAAVYNHIAIGIKAAEAEKQLLGTNPSGEIFLTEANKTETIMNNSFWGIQGRQNIMDQRFMMQYRIFK